VYIETERPPTSAKAGVVWRLGDFQGDYACDTQFDSSWFWFVLAFMGNFAGA
jgi:hypothetical protein